MKYREINAIHGRLRNLSQMRQRAHPVLPESGEVFQRGLYADHIPQQVRQATYQQADCRTGYEAQDRAD